MRHCIQRRFIHLIAAALVGALLTGGCAQRRPSDRDGHDAARSLEDERFANGANQPPNANTLYALSRILVAQGRDSEAEFVLKSIIRRYEDYLPAYSDMAEIYIRSGRTQEAIELLAAATARAPSDPVLLNNLGMCFFLDEAYHTAAEHFAAAAAAAPREPIYRANHAAALGMLGDLAAAERIYDEIFQDWEDVEHNLAVLRRAGGGTPQPSVRSEPADVPAPASPARVSGDGAANASGSF